MNDKMYLKIGERLKEIRVSRELSLDAAASLTGVSKPMLGQIERGKSSPTINTLWKISTGLKIPISFFCQNTSADYSIAEKSFSEIISEENGQMRAYAIFPFSPSVGMEIFLIEFDSGVIHKSPPHADGVEEYIFIARGTLNININNENIILTEDKFLRFKANVPHIYRNPSDECCIAYNMIFYNEY